jgi:hypothetical protein
MTSSLNERDLHSAAAQFERDGFYLSPQIIPTELIQRVIAAIDEEAQLEPYRTLPPTTLRKMGGAGVSNAAIRELVSHPAIGKIAAAITGASMVQVFTTQHLIKPAGGAEKGNVGWHQDFQYWQDHLRGELLTAWVALSDVTEDAGPMRFVVGSHRWGLLNAGDFFSGNLDALRAKIEAAHPGAHWDEVPAILKPGAVSFHHRLTIHGSGPNRSAAPRKSIAIHLRTNDSSLAPGAKFQDIGWLKDFSDTQTCPIAYGAFTNAAVQTPGATR